MGPPAEAGPCSSTIEQRNPSPRQEEAHMSAFFSASNNGWQLYKLGDDQSVTQWTADAIGAVRPLNPFDLTAFNGSVWFDGDTGGGQGRQLYKLGSDGSVTLWTAIIGINPFPPAPNGLFPDPFDAPGLDDLTVFNDALWFAGLTPNQGVQLYKLGNDGSVTKWTAINPPGGLFPQDITVFNGNAWFNGNTVGQGVQLYKLGNDGSVTQWTAINPGGGGLQRGRSSYFNGTVWLGGAAGGEGNQLYKLGNDGSVTKWTAINTGGGGLDPVDITTFEGNAWLNGNAGGVLGRQLYKLGFDGSVTQWTAIPDPFGPAPGGSGIFTNFQDALWFADGAPGQGRQLYKLGNDGSVTKWTALSTGLAGGLDPLVPFVFNDAVWFNGNTASGRQLFKLGNDGSVTQWTAFPGGFDPILVSAGVSRLPPNPGNPPFPQDPD